MELKHLSTFVVVAQRLNFTGAAQELGYVQSSVTAHIKALERDLGLPLFDRLGRRVVLTDAGRELRNHAQNLLNYAEQATEAVQRAGGDPGRVRGTLRIAAPESLCAHRLPPVLRALKNSFPLLQVAFGPANRTSLMTSLGEGYLDAGFLLEEEVSGPMVTADRLAEEALRLVAGPDHHLARREVVRTADLADETLLLIEKGCAQREVMDRELKKAAVRPATMEFVSTEALKRCAEAGLGVALLPRTTVADEIRRGRLTALPWTSRPVLGVYLVLHKDRQPTSALRTLTSLARAEFRRTADEPVGAVN
ncbi:LysR family transcriptional regulator [Streptomyces sp. NPDC050617]|uniref:LysR family transcriptional regulator n=1 Tax=Streptomyces sp. NPDC050617 TaxID=3154628 RepID=UPI00343D03A9